MCVYLVAIAYRSSQLWQPYNVCEFRVNVVLLNGDLVVNY